MNKIRFLTALLLSAAIARGQYQTGPPIGPASGDLSGVYPAPTVVRALTLTSTGAGVLRSSVGIGGPSNWQTVDNVAPWFGLSLNGNAFDWTLMTASGTAWPYSSLAAALELPSSASATGLAPGYAVYESGGRANTTYPPSPPYNGGAALALWRAEVFANVNGAGLWGFTMQNQCYSSSFANTGSVGHQCNWLENEIDTVNDSAASVHVHALHLVGNFAQQATDLSAVKIESLIGLCRSVSCQPWTDAVNVVAGSSNVAILRGPLNAAVSQPSIPDQYVGEDAGGVLRIAQLASDQNGGFQLAAANNGNSTTAAFSYFKGSTLIASMGSAGDFEGSGFVAGKGVFTNAGAFAVNSSFTAASVLDGVILASASAAGITLSLPTGASIVTQLTSTGGSCFTGLSWTTEIVNSGAVNSFTVAGATGSTFLAADQTATYVVPIKAAGTTNNVLRLTWVVSSCPGNTVSVFQS